MRNIAYFVSSHGFGHAARSAAIMEAVLDTDPTVHFEIYSGTPEWFFRDSHLSRFTYHPGAVDVGLIQKSPMEHDLKATVSSVTEYLNSIPERSEHLANELRALNVELVICDISPLGIMTAKKAGLPCVLFENFTWEWIYEIYEDEEPAFREINARFREIFALPDYRLQSDPLCAVSDKRTLLIPPVSRRPHEEKSSLRKRVGVPEGDRMGLISMGGIPERLEFVVGHAVPAGVTLVLSGTFEKHEKVGQMILLPHHSDFYHPDLVAASDFLIGKAGYSTIGEVCNSGTAYGYVTRENFRESDVTAGYLRKRPNTLEIDKKRFNEFAIEDEISRLLSLGTIPPQPVNGAKIAAQFVIEKASSFKRY